MARDPVCGMQVNATGASWSSKYEGKTYFFCAPAGKHTFDAEPARYVESPGEPALTGHGCICHH